MQSLKKKIGKFAVSKKEADRINGGGCESYELSICEGDSGGVGAGAGKWSCRSDSQGVRNFGSRWSANHWCQDQSDCRGCWQN